MSKKKDILELGTRRALKPKCSNGQELLENIRDERYKQKLLEVAASAVVHTHDCNWKIRNYDDGCSVYRFHWMFFVITSSQINSHLLRLSPSVIPLSSSEMLSYMSGVSRNALFLCYSRIEGNLYKKQYWKNDLKRNDPSWESVLVTHTSVRLNSSVRSVSVACQKLKRLIEKLVWKNKWCGWSDTS